MEQTAAHALELAVREIERHVAAGGWDGPVRVFALVRTADALEAQPGLANDLEPGERLADGADPDRVASEIDFFLFRRFVIAFLLFLEANPH